MSIHTQFETDVNALNGLGEKIFLDRYAVKDMTRASLAVNDTVVALVDSKTNQREVGVVTELTPPNVTVELRDGSTMIVPIEHVDKPLETHPSQMMDRVARGIASVERTPELQKEWEGKFRSILDGFKFVPAGRILAAAGSDQQLTYYNCYVIPSPKDSRAGIISTLAQMTEIMSRGGGVGINLSSLRPQHAYVRGVNGRSSGSVSWGALYSFVTGLIEQGGSRRGALMLILNDWHPDVFNFINSKRTMGKITNANISVGVSDGLLDAVKADADWDLVFPDTSHPDYNATWDGDLKAWRERGLPVIKHKTVKAREVWDAIIESAWASAEPGIFFNERYNAMSNSWYFAPIICTNPCVTGDTLIYTGQGLRRARDLFGSEQKTDVVVDGRFGDPSVTLPASRVILTGHKPIYRLQTKEGYFVRATADHRVMTTRGWVEMGHVQPGDQVHILNRKGAFGAAGTLEEGRVLGWLVGDGAVKQDRVLLSFFGEEKRELAPVFAGYVNAIVEPLTEARRSYPVGVVEVQGRDEARIESTRLLKLAEKHHLTEVKHRAPEGVMTGSEDMQRGFLQALFTADGGFQDGGEKGGSIRLASNHVELLEGVQQLLANFGIASRVYRNRREAGLRSLPDSHRQPREYWCEAQHELAISKHNMDVFAAELGFLMGYKQTALEGYLHRGPRGTYAEPFVATVESVLADGVEDVFDLTEPVTHSFIANGIAVHNCGEQGLPGWGVCNLAAINLAKFYDAAARDVAWHELGRTVRYSVRFLDNVIDATPYFFDENHRQQLKERRVGLNTMGLAELMIRLGIRYGSPESVKWLDKLYEFIATESYLASVELARERGPFPAFDESKFLQSGYMKGMPRHVREEVAKYGARNVTLLTQAPNGTIGTMVDTSTGIEPFFSWTFFRKSRLGLHEQNVAVVDEWKQAHPGQELPEYFVTAMELSPEEHIRVQAAIQRWVDSSISKTCNVPNEYTVEQVKALYELMFELGCKGGTIYRDGSRDEQVLMLKDDKAETKKTETSAAPAISQEPAVAPLPAMRSGLTLSKHTAMGTIHITSTHDAHGEPFEVFITVGKAGSDLQADAEALGRMISLNLRLASPLSRRERLGLLVSQLEGIGGSRSVGFGINKVLSIPDAVAAALKQMYFAENGVEQLVLPNIVMAPPPAAHGANGHGANGHGHSAMEVVQTADGAKVKISGADMCPECGMVTLVRSEGCKKCQSCGYSEC